VVANGVHNDAAKTKKDKDKDKTKIKQDKDKDKDKSKIKKDKIKQKDKDKDKDKIKDKSKQKDTTKAKDGVTIVDDKPKLPKPASNGDHAAASSDNQHLNGDDDDATTPATTSTTPKKRKAADSALQPAAKRAKLPTAEPISLKIARLPPKKRELVERLAAMGYTEAKAFRALKASQWSLSLAVHRILITV